MLPMTDTPHDAPASGTDGASEPGPAISAPPPVTRRPQDRTGQVGQEDSDSGPDGPFPDPDEYADPHDRAPS
jgi:hypothetical protein